MRVINREIVSAIIISNDNKLLMGRKNPKSGGVYSDCWHIPGGGVDEDESRLDALQREVLEVGIDISPAQVILVDDKGIGEAKKTLNDTNETVLCKMKFNVYEVKISANAEETSVTPKDDLIMLKWVEVTKLKRYKLAPPSVSLFKRLGYFS